MIIQVTQELCAGCGDCLDACTVGAIQLMDLQAVIDQALCTQCQVCMDACPNGAITALTMPIRIPTIATTSVADSRMTSALSQSPRPETVVPAHGLAPLAGAALTILGSEVAPRLADILLTALEKWLARLAPVADVPFSTSSRSLTPQGRFKRRQAHFRRGHTDRRDHKKKM
jgi:NAD-dependent dihydropyrimidine dehydrogenase PreA subunit